MNLGDLQKLFGRFGLFHSVELARLWGKHTEFSVGQEGPNQCLAYFQLTWSPFSSSSTLAWMIMPFPGLKILLSTVQNSLPWHPTPFTIWSLTTYQLHLLLTGHWLHQVFQCSLKHQAFPPIWNNLLLLCLLSTYSLKTRLSRRLTFSFPAKS